MNWADFRPNLHYQRNDTNMFSDKFEKEYQKQIKQLAELEARINANVDENGNHILDVFPYLIVLDPPLVDERYDGLLEWLRDNIKGRDYKRIWVNRIYFRNHEDAMAFKLRWT